MRHTDTADEVLAWLDACAVHVDFQDLGARVLREKNRVIFCTIGCQALSPRVGGRNLRDAVVRAAIRPELIS